MGLYAKWGGAWRVGQLFVKQGGVWKPGTLSAKISGSWGAVATPLECSVSPSSRWQGYSHTGDPSPDNATTDPCVVTASGGTAPYTYAWVRQSGALNITADSPTSDSTAFSADTMFYPTSYSAVFQCTVTDALGATATALVAVEFDGV